MSNIADWTTSNTLGLLYQQSDQQVQEQMRSWIKQQLLSGVATVEFEKVNGEHRNMQCTLSDQHGAVYVVSESKGVKRNNETACPVWDIAQSSWRSFRWDKLKRIELNIG